MATYTVKQGDNLAALAKKWGVTTYAILDANAGVRGLGPGITLRIPTSGPLGQKPSTYKPFVPVAKKPGQTPSGGKQPGTPITPVQIPPKWQPPPGVPYSPPAQQPKTPPSVSQPPYIPPDMRPTEATRQPPPVQRADLSQYNEARRIGYVPQPAQASRQGLIPGALRVAQNILPGTPIDSAIQGYMDRLYRNIAPRARSILNQGARNLENTPPFYTPPGYEDRSRAGTINPPALALRGLANRVGPRADLSQYNVARGGLGQTNAAKSMIPGGEQEVDPETGVIWYRMKLNDGTDSHMMNYGVSTADADANGQLTEEAIDKYESQRADHVGLSITRGEWPQIILESDQIKLGYSDDWMLERGYYWNEDKGYWEHGQPIGDAPQTSGAAMPYSGYGYGTSGTRYSYPKGGGGTYSPYQGYADYTEPGQRGFKPQQIQNRPGRFGMITWRI